MEVGEASVFMVLKSVPSLEHLLLAVEDHLSFAVPPAGTVWEVHGFSAAEKQV